MPSAWGWGYESMKAGSKRLGVALTWMGVGSATEEVQGCSNGSGAMRTRSFRFSWRWTSEGKRSHAVGRGFDCGRDVRLGQRRTAAALGSQTAGRMSGALEVDVQTVQGAFTLDAQFA